MPKVDVTVTIQAPIAEVWRAVNDVEAYPEFMENVRTVTILSDDHPERITTWSVLLKGSVLEWTEKEVVDDANHRIVFDQLDGDLDLFSGHWQLREVGVSGVEAELSVEFEIGIPLLADMLNPVAARALRDNSERMLREIERKVAATS